MTGFEDNTMVIENQAMVPFDFSGEQIRTIVKDGEPWFVAFDVAKTLGYEKPNNAINTHCKKANKISYPETGQQLNIIPESDLYRLITRSKLPSAEKFGDWVFEEVLPTIRKTGSYSHPETLDSKKAAIDFESFALQKAFELLKCSEVSKLKSTQMLFERHGVSTAMLPQYIENVRLTFSATELLNRKDYGIKIKGFNKLMIEKGFLEIKKRKGSAGNIKEFKALTDLGLQYGQNDVSPQSPLDVQPHYFEDCFPDLVGRVAA